MSDGIDALMRLEAKARTAPEPAYRPIREMEVSAKHLWRLHDAADDRSAVITHIVPKQLSDIGGGVLVVTEYQVFIREREDEQQFQEYHFNREY